MTRRGRKLPLPKARYEAPEPWKDADQKQLLQFLKTPSGTKFLLTLHDVAAGRALAVAERTPHDYGITAGMSVMLGLIEKALPGLCGDYLLMIVLRSTAWTIRLRRGD